MKWAFVVIALIAIWASAGTLGQMARCDADGKIRLSETELDGRINELIWVNSTDQTVEAIFVLTHKNSVYRSTDHGATFMKQTQLRGVSKIIRTANSRLLYFLATNPQGLWRTEDQGNTYTKLAPGLMILDLVAHPTRAQWALAYVVTGRCRSQSDPCHADLFLTTNFGLSWTSKVTYVAPGMYDWGDAGKDGVPEGNVYYIAQPNPGNVDQNQLDSYNLAFHRTINLFDSVETRVDHALQFKFFRLSILLAQLTPSKNVGQLDLSLYSSQDAGKSFHRANFPTQLPEYGYTILDLSEGTAFFNVLSVAQNKPKSTVTYGTTYMSDQTLDRFATTLNYTRRQIGSGKVDFKRIKGLEGIYAANQIDVDPLDPTNSENNKRGYSKISFDKGGRWEFLKPPARDSTNTTTCDGCRLNLLGFDATHQGSKSFYSKHNAPGLVVASGSVGMWLLERPDEVNTYMSNDAGQSWSEIAKGQHIYEINNFGGILLIAPTYAATTEIGYSWNQGLDVIKCAVTSSALDVSEIYAAPAANNLNFLVYGTRNNGNDGYIIHVDFSQVGLRQCTANDFEKWSPADDKDEQMKCLMGQHFTYTRRKRESECMIPVDHEVPDPNTTPCVCQREDFGCDYCFEPSADEPGKCIPVPDCPIDITKQPSDCSGTWAKSKGYRLIPGDKCTKENSAAYNALAPQILKCGDNGDGSNGGSDDGLSGGAVFGIVLLVLTFVVGGSCGSALIAYRFSSSFRDVVDPYVQQSAATVYSLFPRRSSGDGGHDYTVLSAAGSSEPRSLLDDLENNDDELLDDEPVELDDSSISALTSTTQASAAPHKPVQNLMDDEEDIFDSL